MKSIDVTKDNVAFSGNFPHLILICGPCRTGTTALSNVFVNANIESHMQPIKSIRRAKESDKVVPLFKVDGKANLIVVKETIGESKKSEFYNPVKDLVALGYPIAKITVIFVVREPMDTFYSWKRMWGSSATSSNLLKSFQMVADIKRYCIMKDISYIPYTHEIIKTNQPIKVVSKLFDLLQINVAISGSLVDWTKSIKFGDKNRAECAHLIFYDRPPLKFIEGVRDWGSYKYKKTKYDENSFYLPDSIFDIYNSFKMECEQKFSLDV